MMKWIQFLLILFLLPGFPLFQMDQAIDIDWLVCENSLITKSEMNDPSIDQNLWFDSKPHLHFFNQVKFLFQLKNPLSVLLSSFQGTSPFWRPPPGFILSMISNSLEWEVILIWMKPSHISSGGSHDMDNWTFGITMIVVGMGGTLLTLWILSLIMSVLKKVFPYKKEEEGK